MIGFCDRVRSLAKETTKPVHDVCPEDLSESQECKEVISDLFTLTELGVNTYNETAGSRRLSLFWLPEELLTLLLNSSGKRMGFCLAAPEKFAVFLDDQPNHVLVLGKRKQQTGSGENLLAKLRQLIRITFIKGGAGYSLKDNTGSALDPEEIILHTIRWTLSE